MTVKRKGGRAILVCEKCGYEERLEAKEVKFKRKEVAAEEVPVIEEDTVILPTTKRVCPRCGNTEVYYELRQTRAADEPPTQIFRCKRCGYIWREY